MNGRQFRETERNIRSNDFLTANVNDYKNMTMLLQMIDDLTARIAKVQTEYQKQIAAGGEVRQNYDVVRDNYDALDADLKNVRDFAKTISRRNPGFEELFRIPEGSGRRKLIAVARVFIANAQANEEKFIAAGIEENFITDLIAAADALENALNDAAESTGERVGATDTLEIEIDAASDIVEDVNPMVRRAYRNNPAKLAQWDFVRKVERHTPVPRVPKNN